MKRNDFIFLTISLLYAIAFTVIFIYQILPEKPATELSSFSTGIKTTGTPTDIEKIKNMIRNKKLSDREALFYQRISEGEEEGVEKENKVQNQNKQHQLRRRYRRGRQ